MIFFITKISYLNYVMALFLVEGVNDLFISKIFHKLQKKKDSSFTGLKRELILSFNQILSATFSAVCLGITGSTFSIPVFHAQNLWSLDQVLILHHHCQCYLD
ncbi:hypothetical protein PanWU01x14_098830 [Parasponia andersonii]|uniref:Uncharacterized protein n=1 Tax=Parasponia andersonii TaxID=3476 RepID=A0A2P5D446_PARAD|nr:hypothetical protein PanWU01x14_098830 [Parasponia andersonii]